MPALRWARRPVFWLAVIEAVFVALAGLYSLATPLFEGPDEIWHYAFADYLAQGNGLPVLQASGQDIRLRNAAHTPLYHFLVAAVIAPIDRSDFPNAFRINLASPNVTPGSVSDRPNLFIHTPHEDFPFRQSVLAVHVARGVSILLGALNVLGIWLAARRLLGGHETLALAATALVAFIPQYVYGTSLVNNDALAATATTWLLVALLHLLGAFAREQGRWQAAAVAGVLLGVTLLSKVGMVAILPLPVAALGLVWWRAHRAGRGRAALAQCAGAGGLLLGTALAVAGWWYLRNWRLYGDPLAWKQWQALAGVGNVTPSLGNFAYAMASVFGTFWADFTMRVDRQWAWVFALLTLGVLGGLAQRARRRDWPALDWPGLALAALCFALQFVAVAGYSFQTLDVHGRLLYPALSGVGVVLALGLTGWGGGPRRRMAWGAGVAAGLIALNVYVPLDVIAPAYARPVLASKVLPPGVTPASLHFGTLIDLVGYRLLDKRVTPGHTARVQLYWQSQAPAPRQIPDTYGSVTLIRPDTRAVGNSEVRLGTSVYPSSEWRPGEIIVAELAVPVPAAVEAPAVAAVEVGVRIEGSGGLTASNAGETPKVGQVTLQPAAAAQCASTPLGEATFGGAIRLAGYKVRPEGITFCWQALQPVPEDYTVFIHLFDAAGHLLPGADSPPRQGNYPTSAWGVGEQIEDFHPLAASQGGYLMVGWYRLDTGERLGVDGTDQTELKITP